ncbi:glycosyltransferase family 4 protein [Devosia sp.]|uniref:glycosyltransferase family 4 protein n=1 Tax=Devosia sp. TaxID=1871048 RepID=UPI003BAA3184
MTLSSASAAKTGRPASVVPKVLLVAPQTRFSMRPYVLDTCKALSAHVEVSVLVLDRIEEPDLPFRQLTIAPQASSRLRKLLHFLAPQTYLKLRRLVTQGGYDLIHILNGEGYPYCLAVSAFATRAGIPLVVTVHDPVAHVGSPIDKANEILALHTMRRARAIHVHKSFQVPQVLRRLGSDVQISVIPHADIAHNYLRFRRGLPRSGSLLFFGRVEAYKGLDTLLDALGQTPEEITLTIAGPGPLSPSLRTKIGALGTRVRLENRYLSDPEVAQLLEQAGTLVLPYTQVTQSALPSIGRAFGLKLVASDLPGFRDEIAPPGGWLFAAGSASSLAGALIAAHASKGPGGALPIEPTTSFAEAASQISWMYQGVLNGK